jgi:hypothetical protein
MGTMDTTYFIALVGLIGGHVAGISCVLRSTSICWDTGVVVTGSPTVAFYGATVAS